MFKTLHFLAFLFIATIASSQCVTTVDFNTWNRAGQPGNGNWVVQNGGTQVHQTVNGDPTFYISPFNLMNVHISGNFKSTDSDNDWMGFVFSFLNPMGATDSFDCYLFDWKQEQQNGASSGKSLDRVFGVIPPSNYTTTFWNHTNTPEFTVLQNDFGGAGWIRNFNHSFDLYLTYTEARILVDGAPVFDWHDCFKPGRFGFYNYSQQDCYYSNFQYDLYVNFVSPTQACAGATANFTFTNTCVTTLNQYQSITWNFGDGTPPLIINNPTLANVNASHVYSTAGTFNATMTVVDNNGCSATATNAIDVRNPITLTPNITPPLCNGAATGTISVTPTGGFGNYTYAWNTGLIQQVINGVTAGTYSVTVTDGVCNTSGQYTVSQPSAVSATTSHTDAPCGSNGTATITASGGTPPYTVNWAGFPATSGVPLSMPAGTWIADLHDAHGCSALLQYRETISQLPCGVTSSLTTTNVSCYGGSNGTATLTVGGGSGGSVAGWTTVGGGVFTKTGLASGTYSYNYTDANSAHNFSFSVTITQPGAAMVAQLSTVGIACSGANNGQALASVISGGVSPYTYAWSGGHPNSPSANNLSPGPITVTITDANGCTATATGTVSSVPSLVASLTTVMDSCYHSGKGSVTVHTSGGNPPYTYLWNNLSTDTLNRNLIAGTYSITVSDYNNCSTSGSATVNGPANAYERTYSFQNVSCYGENTGSFNVVTTGGTPGYNYTWNPSSVSGNNPTGLAAGIYSFTVSDTYGCTLIGTDTIVQPDSALTAVTSHTNVTCNGLTNGTITINISGGTPPYTYQGLPIPAGTNTLTNLAAGTYSGTLLDSAGCSLSVSETIIEPTALSVSETHTDVTCNGTSTGSINITPSGGTLPYSYLWNDAGTTQNRTNIATGNYSVTVSDSSLCSASVSVNISEPSALSITETHTDVLCNGASTGSINTTPSGGTAPYTYAWNDAVTTQNRANIAAGNYSVTLTDNSTCSASVAVTISEPTALVVTTSHTNVTCHGLSDGTITINISGGTAPYSYLGTPVPAGSTTIPNLPANTYSGNVTDANGCSGTATETITEPGPQSVSLIGTNNPCFGATQGAASANFINATGTVTYNWNGGLTGANISNLAAGTYTVTATDQNSCTVTDSVVVTEPAAVVMNVTTVDAVCYGANGSATANPVGGGTFTYLWSNAATTQTVSIPAGNYTVSATDLNTCQQTASLTINQPNGLTIQEIQTNVNCFGDTTGDITLTVSGGSGSNYTYAWSPNVSNTNVASSLSAGSYTVTITDQGTCPQDTTFIITQPVAPVSATVQMRDISCFGASDGIIAVTASGGSSGFTYIWNPNVSTTDSATGLSAGNYSVTVNDVNSCSTTVSGTIAEPAQLILTPAQTDLVCYQVNTGMASVTETGGTPSFTYTWNPNVSTTNSATNLAAGSYNLTVTDNSACTASVSFTLTEPTQLVVSENHTNVKCFGDTNGDIILSASGATPGYTYQWNPNVSSNDSALSLAAGSYSFTVSDANLCSVTQSVNITAPNQILINATADSANCFGASTGAITTSPAGGTSPYSFVWNDAVTTQNRTNIPAGNYSVTVSDNNACSASVSAAVYEPAVLDVSATSVDVSCYHYTDGQISATNIGGTPNYTFTLSSGSQNSSGLFTSLGAGNYTVTVTDAGNCSASTTAIINEPDSVVISITPSVISLNLGESVQLQATSNQTGNFTYNWQPNFGLSCYDCPNPLFSGNNSVVYTVEIVNNTGCSGKATVKATVTPSYDIFIPNAFTPNGDGVNDTWSIFGNLPGLKQLEVMVFNRWGEKVFESNDIHFGWDGTYKGVLAPPGVYTYAAKFVWLDNHSDNNYKGTITLLR